MEQKKYFFAVDLGATSGRTIVGSLSDGKFDLEELTRFDNNLIETGGHFYWDIYALYFEIIKGLKLVAQRGIHIQSIGIDTWGCDFVYVDKNGDILRNPMAYRDPHTMGIMEKYFDEKISKEKVYEKTGIQFMNFNSLFQMYAMRKAGNVALENADKIRFSKFLATIKTDVPLQEAGCLMPDGEHLNFERLTPAPRQTERLEEIFTHLEFRNLVAKLQGSAPNDATPPRKGRKKAEEPMEGDLFAGLYETEENEAPRIEYLPTDAQEMDSDGLLEAFKRGDTEYNLIENEEDALEFSRILMTKDFFAFDTETTSVDPIDAELVGMSFATAPGKAWYVAVPRETATLVCC